VVYFATFATRRERDVGLLFESLELRIGEKEERDKLAEWFPKKNFK
jgi:hypothetical protein